MKEICENDLVRIVGGASITSSLVNSFVKVINTLVDLGRNIGSGIRRIMENNLCPIPR